MSNIATTISQSRKLIELGLDPKTADMFWMDTNSVKPCLKLMDDGIFNHRNYLVRFPHSSLFAWSLTALLEVMPNEYQPLLRKECKWYMDAWYEYGNLIAGGCYKPLDAAYEMVCKMLERGLIEKGGEDENN